MKIVQILHGNSIGGMEKFSIDLSNALSKEHKILFLGDTFFSQYLDNSVKFIAIDITKSRNNPIFLWKLFKILKKFQPDIIHIHKRKSIDIMKLLAPFLKTPFVATKHDMQKKKSFYGLDYVVSISDATTSTIKAKNIYKIYNGVSFIEPKKIEMPPSFNIVAVGGLRKVKRYDRLIESVATLSFDYHLTIIGEGEERENLENLIDRLDISNKVSLVGFKNNVNDYLFSADLQIISSISEGFSLAMVEGIFYSSLLLSTKVSGCTEILSDNLLMNQEEISQYIEDVYCNYDKYRESFLKIKKEYKEKLTMEACANNHIMVYKEVVSNYEKN